MDVTLNGERFRDMITQKVFKAIRQKMSWADRVSVQWDNARPHTKDAIQASLLKACKGHRGRVPIDIVPQEAQSPDTNANDLGFYASIDSKMPKFRSFDLDKLYKEVEKAWADYPSELLSKIFDTKHAMMAEIIKHNGDNDFKLPHKRKR